MQLAPCPMNFNDYFNFIHYYLSYTYIVNLLFDPATTVSTKF